MLLTSKEFTLSALSLSAAVAFREWVKGEVLAEIRERLALYGDALDPSERRAAIAAALASIDGGQAARTYAERPDGKRMLVWLSLLPSHPGLTLAAAGDLVPQFEINRDAVDAKLDAANGLATDDEPAAVEPPATVTPPQSDARTPEEKRLAVFDAMREAAGCTAAELAALPIGAAAALYLKQTGAADVDRVTLKAHLDAYAASFTPPTPTVRASGDVPPEMQAFAEKLNAKAKAATAEPPPDLTALVAALNEHAGKTADELPTE